MLPRVSIQKSGHNVEISVAGQKKCILTAGKYFKWCLIFISVRMEDFNEQDIIKGLQRGDSATYRVVVEKFQLQVRNTCLGIVHDHHDAEDLAQEVFLEVFRSVGSFRSDSKLSTWIYRISVNKSINFLRKKKRQKWFSSVDDFLKGKNNPDSLFLGVNNSTASIENQQLQLNLFSAIDGLPENQRIAFVLDKYDELSYKDISDVMGLTVSSVESLIHRAKVNLQKKLWECYKKECL